MQKTSIQKSGTYLLLLLVFSCGNSNNYKKVSTLTIAEQSTTKSEAGFISATVNGIQWKANHEVLTYINFKTMMLGGEDEFYAMGINIPENAPTGKEIIVEASIAQKNKTVSNKLYNAEKAKVILLKRTETEAEGTFSFEAFDSNKEISIKVENGKFKTKLMKQ